MTQPGDTVVSDAGTNVIPSSSTETLPTISAVLSSVLVPLSIDESVFATFCPATRTSPGELGVDEPHAGEADAPFGDEEGWFGN